MRNSSSILPYQKVLKAPLTMRHTDNNHKSQILIPETEKKNAATRKCCYSLKSTVAGYHLWYNLKSQKTCKNKVKHQENSSKYCKTCDTDQQDFIIKSLQSFNYQKWFTQYSQNSLIKRANFLPNSDKHYRDSLYFQKSPNCFWLLKYNRNCPSQWFNVVRNMRKLFEVVTKNKQANLQPIAQGEMGCKSQNFVPICHQM